MKQYVIDELRLEDHARLKTYLDETLGDSGVDGLYWLPLDREKLAEPQTAHQGDCGPFFFALELEESKLVCEFLVRTRERIRCACIQYATEDQRNWLMAVADAMLEKLEIAV